MQEILKILPLHLNLNKMVLDIKISRENNNFATSVY